MVASMEPVSLDLEPSFEGMGLTEEEAAFFSFKEEGSLRTVGTPGAFHSS